MTVATERSCPSCTGELTRTAWEELPLAETLETTAILQHVSVWPPHLDIEVRRCSDCGRSIARTVCRISAETGSL